MIIMVGVTVNVAINGGLIRETQKARRKTEMNAIYEQLVASIKTKPNGKFDVPAIVAVAKNSYGHENVIGPDEEEGYLIIKGKYGRYKYILTEDKIEIVGIVEVGNIGGGEVPEEQESDDFELSINSYRNSSDDIVFFVSARNMEEVLNKKTITEEVWFEMMEDDSRYVYGRTFN